jgi:hypothetical protein
MDPFAGYIKGVPEHRTGVFPQGVCIRGRFLRIKFCVIANTAVVVGSPRGFPSGTMFLQDAEVPGILSNTKASNGHASAMMDPTEGTSISIPCIRLPAIK